MTWFWLAQVAFDVALLIALVRLKRELDAARAEAGASRLEERAAELDRARQEFQERARRTLERLSRLCARAEQWIEQGPLPGVGPSATEEGRELVHIAVPPGEEIPSLRDIERTRHRLAAEAQPNLRALLQDQLA